METNHATGCSRHLIKEVEECFSEKTLLCRRNEVIKVIKLILCEGMCEDVVDRFIGVAVHEDVESVVHTLCCRDAVRKAVIPELLALEGVLMRLALKEAETVQVSRGGQIVPITFGFSMAHYVNRMGGCILELRRRLTELQGRFSGESGAYNAVSLFHNAPEEFEHMVLAQIHLQPAHCSVKNVPPEPLSRLIHELVLAGNIMADIAHEIWCLAKPEIGEVVDEAGAEYNESFKYIEGLQDALTVNHAVYAHIHNAAYTAKKLRRAMKRVRLHRERIMENLEAKRNSITKNALCVVLHALGHPSAHEKVQKLFKQAHAENVPLEDLARHDNELRPYFEKMTAEQRRTFFYPVRLYVGGAARNARDVVHYWAGTLDISLD